MRLDHVIYGTRNLEKAAARLEQEHGLRFLLGGRHPGGTVNSVAPLQPPQYLELLAIDEASDEWTQEAEVLLAKGRTLLGWGLSVDDIELVADRHGLAIEEGSVTLADGSTGSWRIAASEDIPLPFFVAYDGDAESRLRRWQERAREAGSEDFGSFTFIEVGGDPDRMRAWIGNNDIPIRFTSGRPGLRSVGIAGPIGEIVLLDTA